MCNRRGWHVHRGLSRLVRRRRPRPHVLATFLASKVAAASAQCRHQQFHQRTHGPSTWAGSQEILITDNANIHPLKRASRVINTRRKGLVKVNTRHMYKVRYPGPDSNLATRSKDRSRPEEPPKEKERPRPPLVPCRSTFYTYNESIPITLSLIHISEPTRRR